MCKILKSYFEDLDLITQVHSYNVAKYACELAIALGMNNEFINDLYLAALLHDIGKHDIPNGILNKKQKLLQVEWELIKEHPNIGSEILRKYGLRKTAEIVIHHHERYDGKGYPHGINGNDIPLAARIICIADSYDAMIAKRPYKNKMSIDYALHEILLCSGTQFDPNLVEVFLDVSNKSKYKTIALR